MKTMKLMMLSALVALSSAACAPRASITAPAGFAVLEDQKEYVYRAATADGVVIAVRAEKHDPHGSLDFWAEVLDSQLRRNGYALEGAASDVRASGGLPGKLTRYTRTDGGRKYRFWTAVFVTADRVWVVEAGGDDARFKGRVEDGIRKAIESLGVG